MSETNKPIQFWVRFRIGDNESTHQITDVSLNPLGNYKEDFHVIELAPMIKMMDEMVKAFYTGCLQHSIGCTVYDNRKHECNCGYLPARISIESYKAFKRENGLDKL